MRTMIFKKLENLVNSLFQPDDSPGSRLLERALLLILYLFGVVLWVRFLNYGNIPNDRLDWADITFPRLHVIQQAVQQGKLPLYVAEENGLKEVTNLFLSIPDQILSPDVFMLGLLSIEQFIVIHLLIFYSLGYWGLILFKGKYKLSFIAFLPLFLLFNFNGHIVSHLSVGHLTWASYFLYSFFFLLIFEIFDDQHLSWKWIARMSFLQFFIFLSGGYHQFIWAMMFLFLIGIFIKRNRKPVLYSLVFSVFITLFRILPAALISGKIDIVFLFGFPNIERLFQGLFRIFLPEEAYFPLESVVDVMIWELNFYLSLLGMIFVIYFGVLFFRKEKDHDIFKVLIPSIIMLVISIGNFYKVFFDSGIPILSGERVSARFFIMTLITLIFVSCYQFQEFINSKNNNYLKTGFFIISMLVINDITQHMSLWGIEKIIESFPSGIFYPLTLAVGNNSVYTSLMITGVVVSIITFIFIITRVALKKKL